MRLLVATRSPGKQREIRELLAGLPFHVVLPADCGLERRPQEDDLEAGTSYAVRHICLTVMLMPMLLLGIWMVPVLIKSDLLKWHSIGEDKGTGVNK